MRRFGPARYIAGITGEPFGSERSQETPVVPADVALGAISDASASNRYVILVYPGIYTGSNNVNLRWKSYVSLRGVDRNSTIIRGSTSSNAVIPLVDASMLEGIEFSNITLDGSAQVAQFGYDENGSTNVCGASIVFNNVTYVTGDVGSSPAVCVSSNFLARQPRSAASRRFMMPPRSTRARSASWAPR